MSAAGAASPTSTTTASASTSPRRSRGSPSSRSRPRGRTSGSARTRAATSRPRARTPPGASSTATTTPGASGATARSSRTWSASPRRCRGCAGGSTRTSADCARLDRACVLAAAVRLLERGFFRIGSEEYARRERVLRARDDAQGARDGRGDGTMVFDYPAKSGQRRHQGVIDERVARHRQGAQAAARRRQRAARLQGGPALGRRAVGGHQRVPQGGDRRRLLRQGLPHLERDRAGRGRARRLRRGARDEDGAQARGDPRDQGGRAATWATRPRSAAPPTSTRACSTPSTRG